jgi:tetratricopeptide (TPR) repeat protein
MIKKLEEEWLHGRASLGAATRWTAEEMRLVADLGYTLAEQGGNEEAIIIFEGLAALAPLTGYFQSALGALRLRTGELERALEHLDRALSADPRDVAALLNRGEVRLLLGDHAAAAEDLQAVLAQSEQGRLEDFFATRARALSARLRDKGGPGMTGA